MSVSKSVTSDQLLILWEFISSHKKAIEYNESIFARQITSNMWTEVTDKLNYTAGGAIKDPESWAAYWEEYKNTIRRKCTAIRYGNVNTDEEPITLTDIERKYLRIIDENFHSGLPGIEVDPGVGEDISITSPSHCSTLRTEDAGAAGISVEALNIPPSYISPSDDTAVTPPTLFATDRAGEARDGRGRRSLPSMSMKAARRSLVESSDKRAETTHLISVALVKTNIILDRIASTLETMERKLRLPNNE